MVDKTVAALPAAQALTGAEMLYGVQSGSDVRITTTQITQIARSAANNVQDASGSAQTTTGSINSSSTALTLASALDFVNNQGIAIFGAGPVAAVQQPTGISLLVNGTPGSTSYTYQIASVDALGGVGAAVAGVTTSTGNATISVNNYIGVTWIAPAAGPTPTAYIIYRGGVFVGISVATAFNDNNIIRTRPSWCPSTPLGAATSGILVSTISSGAGTTALTLANSAGTTVTGAAVHHDDTAAISAALNASLGTQQLIVPAGTYKISSTISIISTADCDVACARGAIFKSQNNLGSQLIGFNDPGGFGRYGLRWTGGTFDNSEGLFGVAVASNSCIGLTRLGNVLFSEILFKGSSAQDQAGQTTDSGISTVSVNNMVITNCTFLGQGDLGVYVSGGGLYGGSDDAGEIVISNNVFVNCGGAIAIKRQLPRCIIANNSINSCFSGIALFEASVPPIDPGRQCLIANNIIRKSTCNAICIHGGAADTADGSGTGITSGSRTQIVNNKILDFGYLADGTTAYNGSNAFGGTISGIAIQGASQCRIHGNMIGLEDWTNGGNGTTNHKAIYINSFVLNAVTYNPDKSIITDNDFVNVSRGIVEGAATMGTTMARDNTFTNVSVSYVFLNANSFAENLDATNANIRGFYGTTPTETWRIFSGGIMSIRFRSFLDSVGFTKISRSSSTLNFGNVAANSTADLTVTISGMTVSGGQALVNPQAANLMPTGISYHCFVTAADTVTVRAVNNTTGAIVLPSGTYVVNGIMIT